MSADVLTAVFVGLGTVLTAVTGFAAQRTRARGITTRQYRKLEKRFLIALAHIFAVEQDYTLATGRPARARPEGLDEVDDDDSPPPTLPAGAPRAT